MNKQTYKAKIIDELCAEKGIEKNTISYDWITILKKGNIEKKLVNYKLDINSSISEKLANDKYSTYEILRYYNIPIIEHKVLFNENIMSGYGFVNDNFNILKDDEKVVIKVNESSQGKDVFLCNDEKSKMQIVKELFTRGEETVNICPYKEIKYEYRVFCVYGNIEYIYKKQKPFVIGDGKSTAKELVEKSFKYLQQIFEEIDLKYIPAKDEKIIVGWKHNLSEGATPMLIDENEKNYEQIRNIALKTVRAIGLNLAAVDIVVTENEEILVLEVNPNFGIAKFCELVPEGYNIMKKMYSKIIDKMFEEAKNENK